MAPKPTATAADRPSTTTRAREASEPGDWLSLALDHHAQIRSAFSRAMQTPADGSRITAMKGLAMVLNGHSLAEEVVLYPALKLVQSKHADQAYDEQTQAKIEMAKLEQLDPKSDEWLEQVGMISAAVLAHMEEEEGTWFLELKASGQNQARMTARFKEEFERYTRTGIVATNGAWDAPPRPPLNA